MGNLTINGASLGGALTDLLLAEDIKPGDELGYATAKVIYTHHALGAAIVERPLDIAMSQKREIAIPDSPESMIKDAFNAEWDALDCDRIVFNVMRLKRIYGVASLIYGAPDIATNRAMTREEIATLDIYFNVLDPLNTAGSVTMNQNPNAPDFQKHIGELKVQGKGYHKSRSLVAINEEPIYISWTGSGFGYVGRSVYQRALFSLKTFVQIQQTNDLLAKKAGVFVLKSKAQGSLADNMVARYFQKKIEYIKAAFTGNVISIDSESSIETLDMAHTHDTIEAVRKHTIEDIASATPMPSKMLLNDGYAGVLSNGAEDFKATMQFVNGIRQDMQQIYIFLDRIVQIRAWNKEFYARVQNEFPECRDISYDVAFMKWTASFTAKFPNLLEETDSEKIKVDESKNKAIIDVLGALLPNLDPDNKSRLIAWSVDNLNDQKMTFQNPFNLDDAALREWLAKQEEQGGGEEQSPFDKLAGLAQQ